MKKMFCFQCQEALNNIGCRETGVCGKDSEIATLQDGLVYLLKGISQYTTRLHEKGYDTPDADKFITESLYMTVTNANFDPVRFVVAIKEAQMIHKKMADIFLSTGGKRTDIYFKVNFWETDSKEKMLAKAQYIGVLDTDDEDLRSLREFLTYGVKGIAAYVYRAARLEYEDKDIYHFIQKALEATTREDLNKNDFLDLLMECGQNGIKAMSLLDKAHCETYGQPQITQVDTGVRNNPGILISGHDLKDLDDLLRQTAGSDIDVYTHCEMLPAHYYPRFRKYPHFAGNYGNSWWKQTEELELFNGPVIFTTNCIVPPDKTSTYTDRIFTTGSAGLEGARHIADRRNNKPKDFKAVIETAKKCNPPIELEKGKITGGYAHHQIFKMSSQIVEAIREGYIQKFVVMAGCDGRMKNREYYTDFAKALPSDTIILTAGCAKFRYNKLQLGEINGIPRILDAGQCNDSYSLIISILKLQKLLHIHNINHVPVVYNLAWYEQKSIIILLALLSLGIHEIHIGPTIPAFFSTTVLTLLKRKFGIDSIHTVEEDMQLYKIKEGIEIY